MRSARRDAIVPAGVILALVSLMWSGAQAEDRALPPPLVHLADIDASIVQDIRYATRENFTGAVVPGYTDGTCVLARPAALALKRAQAALAAEGLSLKVFDCYRPKRAVAAFMHWARDGAAADTKGPYHPRLTRRALVTSGYIAARSMHSTGYAVDLTLVRRHAAQTTPPPRPKPPAHVDCRRDMAPAGPKPIDGAVAPAMGTSFDCFDAASHHGSTEIARDRQLWRRRLAAVMGENGFSAYEREWWHYVLRDRPGQAPQFDVEVRARRR